jgi:hypothetical protein
MVVLGVAMVAAFGVRLASARADTALGSYSVIATAPGFEGTEDEPSAQAHPEGQGAVPYTTTLLSSGGLGYALSTVAWPGSYGGNAGSLILVALPSQAGGVPVPDAVKQGIGTVAPSLQYPIRAEARAGSSPDASFNQIPGTTLTSHADTANAQSAANVQGASQPGAASFGNMHSESSSTINGNAVKAVATSLLQNVDIGGVIKIKSVTSTATATAGSSQTANGATIVQGLTIAGQNAYLDGTGLHIGTAGQPLNATAAQIANQALGQAGMKFYVAQPHQEQSQGTTDYNAGAVYIQWIPPGDTNNNVFLFTLGGARVSVAAGEGFGTEGPPEVTVPPIVGDTGGGDTSVLPATADAGATSPLDAGGASTPLSSTQGSGPPSSLGATRSIAATFGGLGVGWILVGLAAAALIGFGSKRLREDLLDRQIATCPLEVRR